MIPEKYNVVTGSHEVFVEYGNVGTKFDYIATEGFGWMNASFEVGMNFLSAKVAADLEELKPPYWPDTVYGFQNFYPKPSIFQRLIPDENLCLVILLDPLHRGLPVFGRTSKIADA